MHLDVWTLVLQAANFLVLVWLLHRFLYRPILKVIDTRRDAERKLAADLEARNAAAAALQAELEKERAAVAEARDGVLRAARDAAAADRKSILAQAQAEAEALKAQAQTAFERERADAAHALGRDAARLAVSIVRRLLQQSPEAGLQAAAIERICQDIDALPDDVRQRIAERMTANERPPDVVTASPLDEAAKARLADALSRVFGAPVQPVFRVDASLLAGVEVHFPFTILRRTWADDLARIEAELVHDDAAP